MDALHRRCLAYGLAAVVTSALVWAGFVRTEPADLGTLLGSIDTQLRTAYAIPPVDKQGRPLEQRAGMLASVEQTLDAAERQAPDLAMLREYRGFLHHLRGEYRQAAACYRQARELQGVDADMRDTLVFNEARMLAAAGDPAAAQQVFARHQPSLQPKHDSQACLEQAALLSQLERGAEAVPLLQRVLQRDEVPMAWVRAGEQFEQLGDLRAADAAFAQAAGRVEGANYFRARLKLRQGDVDSGLQLLGRALAAAPAQVRRWVDSDQATWQGVATDARYQQLLGPETAPAAPVR